MYYNSPIMFLKNFFEEFFWRIFIKNIQKELSKRILMDMERVKNEIKKTGTWGQKPGRKPC